MNTTKAIAFVLVLFLAACGDRQPEITAQLDQAVLIPKPVSVKNTPGGFQLSDKTAVLVSGGDEALRRVAAFLGEKMKASFGKDFEVAEFPSGDLPESYVLFELGPNDSELGSEGYNVTIENQGIRVSANAAEGAFRGLQTLMQLLPSGFGKDKLTGGAVVAAGTIRDYPAYGFRGSMLDVSRHFFNVDEVKRYIDLISFYKMNILHLHLSDDQGWRIEIKSWPNLTKHGGSTEVGGGEGGFYTQEQFKELVAYARDRYVTIIPEIDMPGHTNAALASYPEVNCNNKAPQLYTKTEVGFSTLCVRKEITYKFVEDVVRELSEISPGPYLHLGGDESHVTKKADFIYFINRIQQFPKKYGKKMIGWEEIAQAKLDTNTIVQYWSNAEHAKEAVKQGAKIIMSPASKVYLDMKYDSTTKLGLKWAGTIEVDSAYNWALSSRVNGIPNESILGVEAPVWSETLTNIDEVEFMVFPRLPGVAEIGWTPESARSWDEYKVRLAKHGSRMKEMDIDFYESKFVNWESAGQ